jgi:hypothetical protein
MANFIFLVPRIFKYGSLSCEGVLNSFRSAKMQHRAISSCQNIWFYFFSGDLHISPLP